MAGETTQPHTARIHHDQLAAAFGELLEIGRGDGVVLNRVRADDDGHIGVFDLVEGRRDSARSDVLHQRRDRGGVAEPRAVIDVVMAKALTDHFLEQIGFFIGAFRTAKARHLAPAPLEALCCEIQRLVPCGLAEHLAPIARIDIQPFGGRVLAADQRFGQAVIVVDIVKAKAPLDAEPPFVRRAVDTFNIFDLVVLHLERNLTAHTTEGADAFDLTVVIRRVTYLRLIHHRGRHKRPRRAGLHAFAAGHTGRCTHRIVDIKNRIGIMPTPGHANHIVDLHLAAGADAEVALDASIKVHTHCHMAVVQQRNAVPLQLGETAALYPAQRRHFTHMARFVVGHLLRGLIGQ